MKLPSSSTQFSAACDCEARSVRVQGHCAPGETGGDSGEDREKRKILNPIIYTWQVFNSRSFPEIYHTHEAKIFVKKFPKPWC